MKITNNFCSLLNIVVWYSYHFLFENPFLKSRFIGIKHIQKFKYIQKFKVEDFDFQMKGFQYLNDTFLIFNWKFY